MKGITALAKIRKRTEQLQKKYPGKTYSTLRTQAKNEYNAGTLPKASKPRKKRKAVTGKRKYKVTHRVKKVGAVKRTTKRARSKKSTPATVRVIRRTVTKYRSVGKRSSGTNTALIVGGLAIAGILAYKFLSKPAAAVPPLVQTGNQTRDTAASNLLAYAQAANLGATAITTLINAINSWGDNSVISASTQVSSGTMHIGDIAPPAGGPSITLNTLNY